MAKQEKKKEVKKKESKVPEKVAKAPKAKEIHASYLIVRENVLNAFKELRKQKIVCIANHRDSESGTATILELISKSKREYIGYATYPQSEERHMRETATVELAIGAVGTGVLESIAGMICVEMQTQKLQATFDGTKISVSL